MTETTPNDFGCRVGETDDERTRRLIDEAGWYGDAVPHPMGGFMGRVWSGHPPVWIVPVWAATEDLALAMAYAEACRIENEREHQTP